MSSIPLAGLAKTLTMVTVLLHPAAHHGPVSYTVRPGDSLSAIAAHTYGNSADWPAVWWANRRKVANPNMISAGQKLQLSASGNVPAWMARAARAAASDPAPAAAVTSVGSQPSDQPASAQSAAPASTSSGSSASSASSGSSASLGGADWAAIAACESGGNWSTNTGNGFYGGLQFSEQTWLAYGGGQYASSANEASESQQIAVAQRVLAGQGIGAWPVCGAR
jgi:LysM repeat protein